MPFAFVGEEHQQRQKARNLDKKNSEIAFDIFSQLPKEFNQSLLIVTHDPGFAASTSRIIEMEDGKTIKQ